MLILAGGVREWTWRELGASAPIPLSAPVPVHIQALFPSLSRRHSISSVTVSFVARHRGSGRTLPSVPGGKIRIKGAIVLFSLQLTLILVKGKLKKPRGEGPAEMFTE